MPDTRFHKRLGPFSVGDIVTLIGAKPAAADKERVLIHDIAALRLAKPGEVSVFTDRCYLEALATTEASVIVTTEELARDAKHKERLLHVANPRLAFAQIGKLFYPAVAVQPGISDFAQVQSTACVGAGTQVDAGAVIGHDVEIGADCHIAANVVLGDGVRIGDGSRIGAGSVVSHALIGRGVTIATCVTIGSEGFGFIPSEDGLVKMLQLGRVIIEDQVQIGANCAIDRGTTEDTVIGTGTVLDNQVHIAHNVQLGRHCVICAQVGIAGSTVVGDGVMMGGQVGVADHLTIGARAQLAAKSGVTSNVAESEIVGGYPAIPIKAWHRQTLGLARLFGRTPRTR